MQLKQHAVAAHLTDANMTRKQGVHPLLITHILLHTIGTWFCSDAERKGNSITIAYPPERCSDQVLAQAE